MHFDLSNLPGFRDRKRTFSNSYVFSIPSVKERSKRIEQRRVDTTPFRILDAPGLINDYYLNLLDWRANRISIALGDTLYNYNVSTKNASEIFNISNSKGYISCVKSFENKLAIGDSTGQIQIYDYEMERIVDRKAYNKGRVGCIDFSDKFMSSGDKSGTIYNADLRVNNNRINNLTIFEGHTQEVCGLKWSPNYNYLASGSNDDTVRVWKVGSPISKQLSGHESAVKALDWCPWKSNILCTGGGSKDKTIKFWDIDSGDFGSHVKPYKSVSVNSQVCTINYLNKYKEIVTGHGFQENDLKLWKSSEMKVISSFGVHDSRVLHTAVSPDECTIVSLGADESLKFWKIAEASESQTKRDSLSLR